MLWTTKTRKEATQEKFVASLGFTGTAQRASLLAPGQTQSDVGEEPEAAQTPASGNVLSLAKMRAGRLCPTSPRGRAPRSLNPRPAAGPPSASPPKPSLASLSPASSSRRAVLLPLAFWLRGSCPRDSLQTARFRAMLLGQNYFSA